MQEHYKFLSQEDEERYNIIKDVTVDECSPCEKFLEKYRKYEGTPQWHFFYKMAQDETFSRLKIEREALRGDPCMQFVVYGNTGQARPVPVDYQAHLPSIHKDTKLAKAMKSRIGDKSRNTLDFDTSVPRWLTHGLSSQPDIHLTQELIGEEISHAKMMPQQVVYDIVVQASVNKLIDSAAHFPNVAVMKGIETFSTILTPSTGAVVGKPYLMKATIVLDLLKAMKGEISIFAAAPRLYWKYRRSLNPRVIKGFAYSFDSSKLPEFSQILTDGRIGLYMKDSPKVGLAWKDGTEDSSGRSKLVETLPFLTEEDILNIGVQTTERMFTRILSVTDVEGKMEHEPEKIDTDDSAAAFAQTQDYGAASYQTFGRVTSEVPIHKGDLWIAALDLAKGTDRRGSYIYNENRGPSTFVHRILHNDSSRSHIRVVPKQINFANIMLGVTSQLLQADIIAHDYPTSGQVTQDQKSFIGSLDSGSLVEYVAQVCSKRFVEGATVMAGSLPLNDGISIIGAGTSEFVTYDVLTSVIPSYLVEAFAEMSPFIREDFSGTQLAYYPYLSMLGTKTRANPSENNGLGSGVNMVSLYAKMYPNIEPVTSDFNFATNPSGFQSFLDVSKQNISLFTGTGVETRRTGVADLFSRIQGNLDVGPGLANVHDQEYTNLYYTEFSEVVGPNNEWDVTMIGRVYSIGNKYPFSPNDVSHCLSRILPVIYSSEDDLVAYIGITDEVVSLQMDDTYVNYKLPTMIGPVHPVAGWGNETSISDHAMIEQHLGGGFVDFLKRGGRVAVPIIKSIVGNLVDLKAPGASILTNEIFDALGGVLDHDASRAKVDFVQGLLNNSARNPYAPLLSPITHSIRAPSVVMGRVRSVDRKNVGKGGKRSIRRKKFKAK